jgi:hypothetical protein
VRDSLFWPLGISAREEKIGISWGVFLGKTTRFGGLFSLGTLLTFYEFKPFIFLLKLNFPFYKHVYGVVGI